MCNNYIYVWLHVMYMQTLNIMKKIYKYVIEKSTIKLRGNSVSVTLKRDALKVYGLDVGSEIEIEYRYPEIIIRKAKPEDEKKRGAEPA